MLRKLNFSLVFPLFSISTNACTMHNDWQACNLLARQKLFAVQFCGIGSPMKKHVLKKSAKKLPVRALPSRQTHSEIAARGSRFMDTGTLNKHLALALQQAIEASEMCQSDLARLSALNQSTISRLTSGKVTADATSLDALRQAFTDPKVRADLVHAYIKDMTTPEARNDVSITPRTGRDPLHLESLSKEGLAALRYLLDLQHQGQRIEPVLVDFARAVGFGSLKVSKTGHKPGRRQRSQRHGYVLGARPPRKNVLSSARKSPNPRF